MQAATPEVNIGDIASTFTLVLKLSTKALQTNAAHRIRS